MSLRIKLLLAQAPLAIAVVVLALVTVSTVSQLGDQGQQILSQNYRSVLAAQGMNEAIERLDSAAMMLAAGQSERAAAQAKTNHKRFQHELDVEANNITEPGEQKAVEQLRDSWVEYQKLYGRFTSLSGPEALNAMYFSDLEPSFRRVKARTEEILSMNQDAMVYKSDRARELADSAKKKMAAAALAAFAIGVGLSLAVTTRLLRPLSVLNQAVGRLGEGDFGARALVGGRDEIAQLAHRFNDMADHLSEYRSSSLGELLLAQRASQAAIDSLPDPTIVFTPEGTVLSSNHAGEDLVRMADQTEDGLALQGVLGRVRGHVLQGKGPYVPKGFEEAVTLDLGEGQRSFLPRATPVYDEQGKISGATVILQDVTRLRRFDELKNDLVATVAHEFRTPLTSLRMSLHLCLELAAGPLTEKQADLLYAAREDCERLQGIVDELLNLARIQSGRIEIRTRPTPVASLIQTAVAGHRSAAESKHIRLEGEPIPPTGEVLADADRVQLVLSNLLTNAVRHTPPRGTIQLRTHSSNGHVRFEVIDTGEGIPKEYQQAVFDKFFRVPGAASGGAGLGLFISKEIVEAHGGRMGLENNADHGCMFWFTLPRVEQAAVTSETP